MGFLPFCITWTCFQAAVILCRCDLVLLFFNCWLISCCYQPPSLIHITSNPSIFLSSLLVNNYHPQFPIYQTPLPLFSVSKSFCLLIPFFIHNLPVPPLAVSPSLLIYSPFCPSLSAGLLAGMGCVPRRMCAPEWNNALCSHFPPSPSHFSTSFSYVSLVFPFSLLLSLSHSSVVIWRAYIHCCCTGEQLVPSFSGFSPSQLQQVWMFMCLTIWPFKQVWMPLSARMTCRPARCRKGQVTACSLGTDNEAAIVCAPVSNMQY